MPSLPNSKLNSEYMETILDKAFEKAKRKKEQGVMLPEIKIRERVICGAIRVDNFAVIPVPVNQLPMDLFNALVKQHPGYFDVTNIVMGFLTNHGRFVNDLEAKAIAIHAGQVEETRAKGLCVTDLFNHWN